MDDTSPAIRVSDQDRSDTMRQLCDGFGQGRLNQAEFEARTDLALAAVTPADLRRLTDDLPIDQRAVTRAERAELMLETRWWIAGAVLMNGTWLVQSLIAEHAVHYWPGLPLAIWALILIGAVIAPGATSNRKKQPAPEIVAEPSRAVEPSRHRTPSTDSWGDTPSTGAR